MADRRRPLTMGLLWVTMSVIYLSVLIGFTWHKEGLSFLQVLGCTFISCILMMIYAWPASHLGAISGQSYGSLIKGVFGRFGTRVVAFNLIWMFVAWYGLTSLFLAESLHGLFHLNMPLIYIAPVLAVVMACNNFWGFKGVANFARFFAAPLLIAWVGYTLFKTVGAVSPAVITAPATCSFPIALTIVANFIIGIGVWGNEADYWRFGTPKKLNSGVPLFVALIVGMVVFPTTGWLVASMTGISDLAKATAFMNDYSFGGIAIVGAIVLGASYFALNDSNLYGSTSALSQFKKLPHKVSVSILTTCGAILAAVLSLCGCAQALEKVASLNCVVMALPTVILIAEFFIVRKVFNIKTDFSRVPSDHELPPLRMAPMVSLVVGCIAGIAMAGVIPGCDALHVGICSLQSWLIGLAVYLPLRWWEIKSETSDTNLLREAALRQRVNALAPSMIAQQIED